MQTVMYGQGIVWSAVKSLIDSIGWKCHTLNDSSFDSDRIIITPGIPPHHRVFQLYQDKIIGELDLCQLILNHYHLSNNLTTIGITWTDGKSTTTWIVYQLLKHLQDTQNLHDSQWIPYRPMIGGNFEPAVSNLVEQWITDHRMWVIYHPIMVIETSSFMWYMIQDWMFDYTIFTNFTVDHLNRHPDMKHYRSSKSNIIWHTKSQSRVNPTLTNQLKEQYPKLNIQSYRTDFDISQTSFVGPHNAYNRWVALDLVTSVCDHLGYKMQHIAHSFDTIKPLHHRTEYITSIDQIAIYSDAHGLTWQAQESAIKSFDQVVLICGWSDKGFDFHTIQSSYRNHVCASFCFGQTQDHFQEVFNGLSIPCRTYQDFEQCIRDAFIYCQKNSCKVLLFSPGCASFDMFHNREDRANHFINIIYNLSITNQPHNHTA